MEGIVEEDDATGVEEEAVEEEVEAKVEVEGSSFVEEEELLAADRIA